MRRSIVVGVDGREHSYRALAYSAGLARRERATLNVCYVRPYTSWQSLAWQSLAVAGLPGYSFVGWDPGSMETAYAETAREVSDEAVETFNAIGIAGEVFLRSGDITKELARLADEQDADLIVIGAPRRLRAPSAAITRRLTHGFRHGLYITP